MRVGRIKALGRSVVVLLVLVSSGRASGLARVDLPSANDAPSAEFVSKNRKPSAAARRLAKVRSDLHRNLDGKGQGFIRGWSFDSKAFTLTIDKARYQQNLVYAATITARSIFDMNDVPLPTKLIIRDRSGELLGEGPFTNVPRIVD
jgi:hypothetical protein